MNATKRQAHDFSDSRLLEGKVAVITGASGTLRREGCSVRLPKRCARNVSANWPTRMREGGIGAVLYKYAVG